MRRILRSIREILPLAALFLAAVSLGVCPAHGAKEPKKRVTNSLGMEFVLIRPGTFMMGSPPEEAHRDRFETQHEVVIKVPFYMQTTEVTLKQWWELMRKKFFGTRKGPVDLPVTEVSWYDAKKYVEKINRLEEGTYRLPTEAEWEYACRAGTTTAYSWGGRIECKRAMFANNSLKADRCVEYYQSIGLEKDSPAPVKSFPPNPWGLYDMHGNVWEWCRDSYHREYEKADRVDPCMETGRMAKVKRGGSWFKYGYACRSANRAWARAPSRLRTTGFRLVLTVPYKGD